MSYYANVYNVLIASPSDVSEERKIIVEVIHEWNARNAAIRKLVLIPLMWETHSAPEYSEKPQNVINREVVDHCDLAIGAFWTRLGTPTDNAESGTIEEINRISDAGKLVMLYFSKKDVPYEHDPAQLAKVKNFKAAVRKNGYVGDYSDLNSFKHDLLRQLDIKMREFSGINECLDKMAIAKTTTIKDDGSEEKILRFMAGKSQEDGQAEAWEIEILKILFYQSAPADRTITYLRRHLKIQELQGVLYFIDRLKEQKKVERKWQWTPTQGYEYFDLTAVGRRWLIENKYIPIEG